jgi:hypothetical protein
MKEINNISKPFLKARTFIRDWKKLVLAKLGKASNMITNSLPENKGVVKI